MVHVKLKNATVRHIMTVVYYNDLTAKIENRGLGFTHMEVGHEKILAQGEPGYNGDWRRTL